jgi:hypothetical protein
MGGSASRRGESRAAQIAPFRRSRPLRRRLRTPEAVSVPARSGRRPLADARRAGEPFAQAWPTLTADHTGVYRLALDETREAWERAYEHRPATDGDRAAWRLAAMVNRAP